MSVEELREWKEAYDYCTEHAVPLLDMFCMAWKGVSLAQQYSLIVLVCVLLIIGIAINCLWAVWRGRRHDR